MLDQVTACDIAAERHLRLHGRRLEAALMARLRASVAAHRAFTTVRREERRWRDVAPGWQAHGLRRNERCLVEWWQLEAGARLQWPAGAGALELLVVAGALGTAAGDCLQTVQDAGYFVAGEPHRLPPWRALAPTTVYVRQRLAPLPQSPGFEAHWWRLAVAPAGVARPRGWVPTWPGVEVMDLSGDRRVASMLVRLAAGASIPDREHACDADCVVLQGDMFLGDVLLRAGDYQHARAGSVPVGMSSDAGATFYLHGAPAPMLMPA